ncbi:MAG: glucosaminidase domain-containing protein [Bacteroidota bacterium]|nr:glucosaminidase domain-containing protein [Bacteroidota bacterium]
MTKQTRAFLLILAMSILYPSLLIAQHTRKEYIQKYTDVAIREMKRTGIPASITMAQALLESDNGNSKLARRAKNHFGIKCGGSWEGKTFHQDDDARHECFRKYKTVNESFCDHSDFLKKDRYANLFKLSATDYKGWARGLKKAGYATNPKYPSLLIKIIEANNLHELDKGNRKTDITQKPKNNINNAKPKAQNNEEPEFVLSGKHHQVKLNNRVKYIVVKSGDSFCSINKEFDLMAWQLPKYNELHSDAELSEGQVIYLQPKRRKAEVGFDFHKVKQDETMYEISQKYAVKIKKLYEINLMPFDTQPEPGTKLNLRKKRK